VARQRSRRLSALARVAVPIAGMLFAAVAPAGAEQVARAVLPNGLTVVAVPRERAPLAAIVVMVKTSVFDETPETAGIRQLVQQVLMRGTTHQRGYQIAVAIEEVGGSIEASAAPDYVAFDAVCLASGFERAMELVADIVCNPAFDPAEVAGQRQALLGYQRMVAEDNYRATLGNLLAALYAHHPYGLPAFGTPDTVRAMTGETLRAFHAKHYVPGNTVVAVTGGVSIERTIKAGKAAFGSWSGPPPPEREPVEPPPLDGTRLTADQSGGRQITLMIGFRVAGPSDPDYPTLKVIESLLGGGMISRFFREVREREGLAYQVNCLYTPNWLGGVLAAYALTGHLGLEAPRRALVGQFTKLRDELVPEEELAAAKRFVVGGYLRRNQSSESQATALAWAEACGLGYEADADFPAQVMRVTPQDVMRVAKRYFGDHVIALRLPAG
jgi:zinc protease